MRDLISLILYDLDIIEKALRRWAFSFHKFSARQIGEEWGHGSARVMPENFDVGPQVTESWTAVGFRLGPTLAAVQPHTHGWQGCACLVCALRPCTLLCTYRWIFGPGVRWAQLLQPDLSISSAQPTPRVAAQALKKCFSSIIRLVLKESWSHDMLHLFCLY